jgi:hypothetical protein
MASPSRFLLIAVLPACSLYFGEPPPPGPDPVTPPGDPPPADPPPGDPPSFEITTLRAIAGEHPVVGIDADGAGGLWVAYREPAPAYYDPADVRIVHLAASGDKLSEWRYVDEYAWIGGIASTGTSVWISYVAPERHYLRELDAASGTTVRTFASPEQVEDLAWDGELVMTRAQDEVLALDADTGGMTWHTPVGLFFPTTLRAIATSQDGLWVAGTTSDRVYLIDRDGAQLGWGSTELLVPDVNVGRRLHLASAGDTLILAKDNQITWLAVTPR